MNNMEKKISVIIPVYNVERYLQRCVDSVLHQTYRNLEVILVDDGSTDASGALCDTLKACDSRIVVVHKENGGLSSARNAGIGIAGGEYLSFIDSDDWIEPDALRQMLEECEKEGVPLVCAGRYDVDSATGDRKIGLCPEKSAVIPAQEMIRRIITWEGCDSSACDKLFAAELFRDIRFPEGKVSEDVAVMYRIVDQAEKIALMPVPVYNYFHRASSLSTTVSLNDRTFHFLEHTEHIGQYIAEHHPAILDSARYFRIRALINVLVIGEMAPKADRKRYTDDLRRCRRELRSYLRTIMAESRMSKKDRLICVLLCFNLFKAGLNVSRILKRILKKEGQVVS